MSRAVSDPYTWRHHHETMMRSGPSVVRRSLVCFLNSEGQLISLFSSLSFFLFYIPLFPPGKRRRPTDLSEPSFARRPSIPPASLARHLHPDPIVAERSASTPRSCRWTPCASSRKSWSRYSAIFPIRPSSRCLVFIPCNSVIVLATGLWATQAPRINVGTRTRGNLSNSLVLGIWFWEQFV